MKVAASAIIALTAVACLVALAISVYPGALNDLLFLGFLLSFLVVPVVGVVGLIDLIVLARKGKSGWPGPSPSSRAAPGAASA